MKINYFDLGLHKEANEVDMFIRICIENNIEYNIYGIEAHPNYCTQLRKKYEKLNNVTIINKAISNANAPVKLYINYSFDGQGNSIFSTKHNVTEDYVMVDGIRFSDLLKEIRPNFKNENNILRFNIEGAEWHLMNNLDEENLLKYFKIILGINDMHKISELEPNLNEYNKILEKNNIKIERYCENKQWLNVDLLKSIKQNFKL